MASAPASRGPGAGGVQRWGGAGGAASRCLRWALRRTAVTRVMTAAVVMPTTARRTAGIRSTAKEMRPSESPRA
ncbi:hypothetical protein B9W64_24245 [Streptomyces sp. CS159]|nr:hypothetical protein B9W64_24245 [Streptomyces sp. CS159]